jgi:DNA-directed RNA polymerase specialized sigma54-like protein
MSIVLKNQVEASERSADALEPMIAHRQAMVCHDVEALMHQIVETYHDINHYVERWQANIADQTIPYEADVARSLLDLYVRLEKTAMKTAQFGRTMESLGLRVERKRQFLDAWRKLKGITCFSPERLEESLAQIVRGDSKTLGEFADELSRDLEQ